MEKEPADMSDVAINMREPITKQPGESLPLTDPSATVTPGQPDSTAEAGGFPTNPNAPTECEISAAQNVPDRQFEPEEKISSTVKYICVGVISVLAHLGFPACIICLIWVTGPTRKDLTTPTYVRALIFICVFLVGCYIAAVIEGFIAGTRQYIGNLKELPEFAEDHKKNRTAVPVIIWAAQSYHYRERTTIEKLSCKSKTSEKLRVVTFEKRIAFPFSRCVDITEELDDFEKGQVNRCKFEKEFGFLDTQAQTQFNTMKAEFIQEAQSKDKEYIFEEEMHLPGMDERTTVYVEEGCRTGSFSSCLYCLLMCTLLTWPYRLYFWCVTRRKSYTFVKLVAL